ncbi:MAG: polysaccharide pyruvyl transferase family protein [Bacteroidales bacterium]|nr:polysaccharide pyruvyl transferase family protein [Bacteroidales bacterium]
MPLLPLANFRPVFEPFRGQSVGYVRTPGNVGDGLIEAATFQLLRAHNVKVQILDSGLVPVEIEAILLPGGGNMGTLYAGCRQIREQVLTWGRPITVLPQSFTHPEPLPYARVFVRDTASLIHRPDAILAPDLALGLTIRVDGEPDQDVGLWLRQDQESQFPNHSSLGDPIRVVRSTQDYLRLAARFRHVITDRLHFAIAALLCGRQATLLPNNYPKNRSVYDTWLKDLGCRWLEEPPILAMTTWSITVPVDIRPIIPVEPKLTFIIPCMGRLDHLQQSLPAALAQPGCRTIVVDYSCPQGTGDWVESLDPSVTVVRILGESRFHLARARNQGSRLATTPWICFLDADIVVRPEFATTVLPQLTSGVYYRPDPIVEGTCGLVIIARRDFDRVGGYDECYRGYGGEDRDLYQGLEQWKIRPGSFPAGCVAHIAHDDRRRTEHYDLQDIQTTMMIGRVYRSIKYNLWTRLGRPLSIQDRERLYNRVALALLTTQPGNRLDFDIADLDCFSGNARHR